MSEQPPQPPPFPQNPAHGNGTCEQCGEPCAVCGPRWCPGCYYVNGVPRDLWSEYSPDDEHPGADYSLAGPIDECEGLDGRPIQWEPGELGTRVTNNKPKGTPTMPTAAMQKLVAEQIAYERIIQAICERRPDLEPGELKAQIQHLATTTVDSHHTWAAYCLERARQTWPLPWEASEG